MKCITGYLNEESCDITQTDINNMYGALYTYVEELTGDMDDTRGYVQVLLRKAVYDPECHEAEGLSEWMYDNAMSFHLPSPDSGTYMAILKRLDNEMNYN